MNDKKGRSDFLKAMALAEIALATGTTNQSNPVITAICTDTRKLQPGCLFVALKGDNFDGHAFTRGALEQGAAAVLCERATGCGEQEILVPDTHAALLSLAAYYRRQFKLLMIGITGSVGKTTTKEMTAAVLSTKYKTLKNSGNLNNEIGLPMTIFDLDDSFEAAVLEMGMSGLGEVSRLSRVCAPDMSIITNIGVSHIEKLGTKENILQAKLEIIDGMEAGAPLLLNGDDAFLRRADTAGHPVTYFGIENEHSQFRGALAPKSGSAASFTVEHDGHLQRIVLPAVGKHNVYNALAAYSAGILNGVAPEHAAAALAEYTPAGMRQRIRHIDGMAFIEDCYNASPDSLKAALGVLAEMQAQRRIAVLGDMLELGSYARQAHEEAGVFAASKGINVLLTYGEHSRHTARKAKECGIGTVLSYDSKSELAGALCTILSPGDAVLFKASRGMGLEDVIDIVYRELKANG